MSKLSEIIELLANTSSTKAKQAILESHKTDSDLKMLFYATLDPMINFYTRGDNLEVDRFPSDAVQRELNQADIRTVITILDSRSKTGHAARDWLQVMMSELVPEDQDLFKRMLKRDLNCKVAGGLVNRVWDGLISEYPCLLADKLTPKRIEQLIKEEHEEYIVQTKADGGRSNMVTRVGSTPVFFSRNGNALETHGVLDEIGKHFEGFMVDGELVLIKDGDTKDRQTGNGIFNKAVRGTISKEEASNFHFIVWDLIPMEAFDAELDETPYKIRLNNLADKLRTLGENSKISLVDTKFVKTLDDVQAYYQEQLALKREGAILKLPYLKWENARSADMLKLKEQKTCELKCVGILPHNKFPELIGSLELESEDGLVKVNSGSGLTDDDRKQPQEFFLNKIIEVEYNAVIKARDKEFYALFLPIYKCVRLDKTKADNFVDLK